MHEARKFDVEGWWVAQQQAVRMVCLPCCGTKHNVAPYSRHMVQKLLHTLHTGVPDTIQQRLHAKGADTALACMPNWFHTTCSTLAAVMQPLIALQLSRLQEQATSSCKQQKYANRRIPSLANAQALDATGYTSCLSTPCISIV